ncbi:hypothetical protein MBLNU457_4968t1 [Dothideomycetes sp. NU457]
MPSKWANDEEDAAIEAQRKKEKEEKKRAKAEKARLAEEAATAAKKAAEERQREAETERPTKRRRLSTEDEPQTRPLLRFETPGWAPSRSVELYDRLNHIEEGTYGFVSRARNVSSGEIVAIKKMKRDVRDTSGVPVTALREIQTLQASRHRHIVQLHEVVHGSTADPDAIYLVMELLEHDLRGLMEDMAEPWLPSEVKTLMLQLTSAVEYLHDHWILHRDLKTSNVLMNNRGQIKLADFGMARFTSDPPPRNLTSLVVTLWYRAPELLLGETEYGFEIDLWSLGCVFGELLTKEPLLQGKNEVDQLAKTFDLTGLPTEKTWPSFRRLPHARTLHLPPPSSLTATQTSSKIRRQFPYLTTAGVDLLSSLLSLNPASRPSATAVLAHTYFTEDPRPKNTAMFPTFPSKAGQERRLRKRTPDAPGRDGGNGVEVDFSAVFAGGGQEKGAGFSLKMG